MGTEYSMVHGVCWVRVGLRNAHEVVRNDVEVAGADGRTHPRVEHLDQPNHHRAVLEPELDLAADPGERQRAGGGA